MKVFYAPCDCSYMDIELSMKERGFKPEWYDDERTAAYKFAEAEHKLSSGGNQRYWAIHVKGRGHIINVILP